MPGNSNFNPDKGKQRLLPASALLGMRSQEIRDLTPDSWFGPLQPIHPVTPSSFRPRQWGYAPGSNIIWSPKADEGAPVDYQTLRDLADAWDLLRIVIEQQKDRICKKEWEVRAKPQPGESSKDRKQRALKDPKIRELEEFWKKPDGFHSFRQWLRMWLEDMIVVDAVALYMARDLQNRIASVHPLAGDTINRQLTDQGITPRSPDVAYQQVLYGMPVWDFSTDDLVFVMRNERTNKRYGFSPVEQIINTVTFGLRRLEWQISEYTSGSTPEALVFLPSDLPIDRVKEVQEWFDGILSGDLQNRRKVRFLPGYGTGDQARPNVIFPKEVLLKDDLDVWLAQIVCFCIGISSQPFMKAGGMNRATAAQAQETSEEEGLEPYLNTIKDILDDITQNKLGYTEYEMAIQEERELDVLKQAQADNLLVGKVYPINEIREKRGEDPRPEPEANQLGMFSPQNGFIPLGGFDPNDPRAPQKPAVPVVAGPGAEENLGGGKTPPAPGKDETSKTKPNGKAPVPDGSEPVPTGKEAKMQQVLKAAREFIQTTRDAVNYAALCDAVGESDIQELVKYSEDQPRDEKGRWTSIGGEYSTTPKHESSNWMDHPSKGLIFDTDPLRNHTDWFAAMGLPSSGRGFDRIERGTADVRREKKTIEIYSYQYPGNAPSSVVDAMRDKFPRSANYRVEQLKIAVGGLAKAAGPVTAAKAALDAIPGMVYKDEDRPDLAPTTKFFAGFVPSDFKRDLIAVYKDSGSRAAIEDALNRATEKTINPAEMFATQSWVMRNRVKEYLDGRERSSGASHDMPWIIHEEGMYKILDGHHRLTKDVLLGNPQTTVKYTDLATAQKILNAARLMKGVLVKGAVAGREDLLTGWIGVDLDSTLAEYDGNVTEIGAPISVMVERVKAWLDAGEDVRIFTARVATDPTGSQRAMVQQWCLQNIGQVLPVTATKDHDMIEYWDDKAVRVEANEGKQLSPSVKLAKTELVKISKADAHYVHAGDGNYFCDACRDWNPGELCRLFGVNDRVVAAASCKHWKLGTPSLNNIPENITTPAEALYEENKEGFGCRRCMRFDAPAERCRKVDEKGEPDNGFIDPMACCDYWKKPGINKLSKAAVRGQKRLEEKIHAFLTKTAKEIASKIRKHYSKVAKAGKPKPNWGSNNPDDILRLILPIKWDDLDLSDDLADMATEAGSGALAELGLDSSDMISAMNSVASGWAKDRAAELVGMKLDPDGNWIENPNPKWAISDTTRDDLRNIVTKAFEKDTPLKELADEIQDAGTFSAGRARMIADTEAHRAENQGNLAGWRASGVVEQVEVMLSGDHDTEDECLVGDTKVIVNSITRGFGRLYTGPLIELYLSNGDKFSGTPNHPVLTNIGWKPLGTLQEGDCLLDGRFLKWVGVAANYFNDMESSIQDCVSSLRGRSAAIPTSPRDFHGDGVGSHVHTITANCFLDNKFSVLANSLKEFLFRFGVELPATLTRQWNLFVGSLDAFHTLLRSSTLCPVGSGLTVRSQFEPRALQSASYQAAVFSNFLSYLGQRHPLLKVKFRQFIRRVIRDLFNQSGVGSQSPSLLGGSEFKPRAFKLGAKCSAAEFEVAGYINQRQLFLKIKSGQLFNGNLFSTGFLGISARSKLVPRFVKDNLGSPFVELQEGINAGACNEFGKVEVNDFSQKVCSISKGHVKALPVFNLTTREGFFLANSIITKNCDDLESENPYDLEDAPDLPAHSNCSCRLRVTKITGLGEE